MADYTIEVSIPTVGPPGPQGQQGLPGVPAYPDAPANGIIYGRKDADWVDMTSPANLQVRRGTAAEVAAITPLEGEPVWATDTKMLSVGDGSTAGGAIVGGFTAGTLASGATPGSLRAADNTNAVGSGNVLGNALGPGSVDLQMSRDAATKVASGTHSFVAGQNSKASGAYSVAVGLNSNAEGLRALALQGGSVSALAFSGIAIGPTATSSATDGVAIGPNSSASQTETFALHRGTADRRNMFAHGIANASIWSGRSQAVQLGLVAKTTDATPTEMVVASGVKLNIPINVALFGTIEIAAVEETNATASAHWSRKFAILNLGGTTSLLGGFVSTIGIDYKTSASYNVQITAENSGDFLKVLVTGDASKTLRWIACVRGVEMSIA